MTPERKPSNTNIEPVQHTGQLEGELQELPVHEDAPSVQDLNTGELEKISPDHSGELVLTDEERTALRAKLAEMRALQEEPATEAYQPRESLETETPQTTESHTGRNIGIGIAAFTLAATAAAAGVSANSANKPPTTQEQVTNDNNIQQGNKNTVVPSPLASPSNIQGLETAPVSTPKPSLEQSNGALNEFGITAAEYQKIVQSYVIDANQFKTPQEVIRAFVDRRNKYYADGDTREEEAKHLTDTAPSGKVGWNAWATELYTKAFMQAAFVAKAQDPGEVGSQYAANDKTVKRMWANSVDAQETEYKLTTSFEITDAQTDGNTITVTGTDIVRDNSPDVPSAASDSHKIGEQSYPNSQISFVLDTQNHRWLVASEK